MDEYMISLKEMKIPFVYLFVYFVKILSNLYTQPGLKLTTQEARAPSN